MPLEEALPSGMCATHTIVASLSSMRLTAEEVGDVLNYLQIANLMTEPEELYSASSTYARLGNGLCKSYTQPYICAREEEFELPYERVVVVNFSETALSMTIKGMKCSKTLGVDVTFISPELGYVERKSDKEVQKLFEEIKVRMGRFV